MLYTQNLFGQHLLLSNYNKTNKQYTILKQLVGKKTKKYYENVPY